MEFPQLSGTTIVAGVFVLLLFVESFAAWRTQQASILARWLSNLGLGAINFGVWQLFALILGASATVLFAEYRIGLFNNVPLPAWSEVVLGIILIDLAKYAEHRLVHQVPLLWRLHLVHHSDTEVDATTHFRHHPGEIIFSYGFGLLVLGLLGVTAAAFVLYGLVYSALSILQHANVRVPAAVDSILRPLLVTPDMHRIHHSNYRPETDSNYGAVLSLWDRMFGSYVRQPLHGPERLEFGLGWCSRDSDLWLHRVLLQPVLWRRTAAADYGAASDASGRS